MMLRLQIHFNMNFVRSINPTHVIECRRLDFKIKPILQNQMSKRRHTDDYFQFYFFTFGELRLSPLTICYLQKRTCK